ncbi:large ribosomal subunit protein bL35c [Magnolia sinica]|uniref:large ribosomal subunit protein bL35c n=1 Tax=Magnolia sinica TaxID=86752 RepID=UPI00265A5438|nr:large ribosomal subunit protein bL35c [Magnolia sinica]
MASATIAFSSICLRFSTSNPSIQAVHGVSLPTFSKKAALKLSSSKTISGFSSILPIKLSPVISTPSNPPPFTVFAAKGYKMKTHKASAKRFRVTGNGKIMRRRAGKQHLLVKKNTKRKLRLSKMIQVNRSDYDNVIGALPYLKVNRKAT